MTTRYDLIVPREGREGKTFFTKIGVAFPNKDGKGFTLSFEALPLPDKEGNCRVLMREPMEKQAASPARRGPAPIDDDIPFAPEWR